jgi:hypothetical protein
MTAQDHTGCTDCDRIELEQLRVRILQLTTVVNDNADKVRALIRGNEIAQHEIAELRAINRSLYNRLATTAASLRILADEAEFVVFGPGEDDPDPAVPRLFNEDGLPPLCPDGAHDWVPGERGPNTMCGKCWIER